MAIDETIIHCDPLKGDLYFPGTGILDVSRPDESPVFRPYSTGWISRALGE
jgi:hypothetical protein